MKPLKEPQHSTQKPSFHHHTVSFGVIHLRKLGSDETAEDQKGLVSFIPGSVL